MRLLVLALFTFALLAAPALLSADEPPTKPADKKGDEAKPDEKPATTETAPDLSPPAVAYRDIRNLPRTMPYAERMAKTKANANAYLDAWAKSGREAKAGERQYIGLIQQTAERWADAAASFATTCADAAVPASLRHNAAVSEARLYQNAKAREAVGEDHVNAALARLRKHAETMKADTEAPMRGGIEASLASVLDATGRKQEATDLRIAMAKRDPLMTARVYRSLIWGLMGDTHTMDGYEAMRKKAEPLMAMLKEQQAKAVTLREEKLAEAVATLKENNPDALDENDKLKNRDRRSHSPLERVVANNQRQVSSAKGMLTRIEGMSKPMGMLGTPVPEWTLEHAFGPTKAMADLKGKVVVMDFWATWCPWCIRSFPAIRDLMEELGDKGLVFVGVTASASSVYTQRYDLDDDLKDKAAEGERPKPAARLVRGGAMPDGETTFGPEEYKAKELEVITQFIANHEMTWPVVMIDKAEPGPKYALGGWPHAVVVDRAGRVRYFKSGALLLDRKEAFEKFKKVLVDLLAEKAP